MIKNYVKTIGFKFDALEGLSIIKDANRKNIVETADFANKHDDNNTFWLVVPCSSLMNNIKR